MLTEVEMNFGKCRRAFVPEGHDDNSSAFQRWTGQFCVAPVPEGRLNPPSAGRVAFTPGLAVPSDLGSFLLRNPDLSWPNAVELVRAGRGDGQG